MWRRVREERLFLEKVGSALAFVILDRIGEERKDAVRHPLSVTPDACHPG
jgi:hypothetical protein